MCDAVVRTDIDLADMIHSTRPDFEEACCKKRRAIKKVLCGVRQEEGAEMGRSVVERKVVPWERE